MRESPVQEKSDGQSWILSGSEIMNIYLSANMSGSSKKRVAELIDEGPFGPDTSDSSLSATSFGLEFKRRV